MKLYYAPGACSLAVHIVLEWIGAPYEAQAVKPGSPELLKVNPSGAVPALDTGEGWILTQAAAILRHLTRLHPEAQLAGGEGLQEQAELDRWLSFFTGDLHPAFFPVFITKRYTTASDDASLKAVRDAGLALVRKRFATMEFSPSGADLLSRRRALDPRRLRLSDGALGRVDVAGRPRRLSRHSRPSRSDGAGRRRAARAGG